LKVLRPLKVDRPETVQELSVSIEETLSEFNEVGPVTMSGPENVVKESVREKLWAPEVTLSGPVTVIP
jgi:hypothetical protein